MQEITPDNVINTATLAFTLDTSAATLGLALATDSGRFGDDGVTNVGTVNVSGLEAGSAWEYSDNGDPFIAGIGTSFTVTGVGFGNGQHHVVVHQTDAAGNKSADAPLTFTFDTFVQKPTLGVSDSGVFGDGITNSGNVFVFDIEAGAAWEYSVNGAAYVAGTGSGFKVTGDGPKTVLVRQTDLAGNTSAPASLSFTLDTSAATPVVALATDSGASGDGITNVGTVNVSGLEAGATWEYSINATAFVKGTGSSFTLTGDGPKLVQVRQTDAADNISTNYAKLSFLLDTSAAPPAVALATDSGTPTDGVTKVGTVNVSGLEDGATWQYSVNGGAFLAGTGSSVTLSGDGPKTVLVHQTDAAGNISGNASLSFTLDTVTSGTITTSGGTVTAAAQTIQGTGEAGASIQLLDGGNPLGAAVTVDAAGHWSSAVTLGATGNHVITAAATDVAGNTATSNAITLTLGNGDIVGQSGEAIVQGTPGSDHIVIGATNLLVNAGGGDDVLSLTPGTQFAVHILSGGNGTDTLDLSATTTVNSVDLSIGLATGSQIGFTVLNSIENVIGGSGPDMIVGNGAVNRLDGGAGRDIIRGGNGADTIIGGTGNDILSGGGDNDTFVFRPGFGKDLINDFEIGGATAASTHDVLDLRGLGFTSIQDVLNHTDLGANAVIHVGADDITLLGVTKAQLAAHQFDFMV